MNKHVLCSVFFVLMIVFSISAVEATDSGISTDNDECLQFKNETHVPSEYLKSTNLSTDAKNQTELISPSNSIYYNGDYSITLIDSNSNTGLANKTVSFVINDVSYNSTTDNNGKVSVNLNLLPGKYRLYASFLGDDVFGSCNFTSNVEILSTIKAADMSKYYNGNSKYTATFYDSHGNVLSNKWISLTVNGKSYNQKTNNKGVLSFDVNLKPGSYKIVALNPITGYKLTTNFVILPTINSNNLNKVVGDSKKFTAKFLKSNGQPLSKQYIKFKIKGKTYKIKTNKNGFASFSLKKFKKGTYKIICYNKEGLSKTYTIKIFKRKASTKLTTYTYQFYPNENKLIKARFSTALADDSCSGKIIKIKINGKTYSKKTDSKGMVYMDLSFLKKGIFTVEYKYGGNKFFKASSSKSIVSIYDTLDTDLKVKGTSSFGYGAGTVLKVSYTAGGVPLAKKTVTLTINNKTYTKTTDSNGVASIVPINLDIGSYNVTYKTNNESKFHGTSGFFNIDVFKRSSSKVTWKCGSSFKDNSQTFKILVTDSNGKPASDGTVKLTIDSETYSAKVSSNGYATIKTDVSIGKYKVLFEFEGNNNYLSSSNQNSITVKLSKFGKGLNQKNAVALKAYLKSSSHCKVGNSKIKALVKSLTKGMTDDTDKAKAIFNFVRDTLSYSYYYDTKYGSTGTLKAKKGNCVDHSHLLVAMFRTAGFNARYVHGKCHFKSGSTTGHVWTQVKIGKTWVCADAVSYRNSLGKINNWNTKSYKVYGIYSSLPF